MKKEEFKKYKLPEKSGVYLFLDKKISLNISKNKNINNSELIKKINKENILYVGKATSLKDRVSSYFSNDLIKTRGEKLKTCIENTKDIFFIETNSVLEAIVLESKYIKEFQPFFNTKEKDDKSYSYVVFTDEIFPKVFIMRGREIEKINTLKIKNKFGPFVSKSELLSIMKILRKIFPYRDKCEINQKKLCFNAQIKLCPGVCMGKISEKDYKKKLDSIKKILTGDVEKFVLDLENKMNIFVTKKQFENAAKLRDIIFALKNVKDLSLIKSDKLIENTKDIFSVESYDLAHISGSYRVGVMCKFEIINNELDYKKNEYKKFKLTEGKNDDLGGLKEILERRLNHIEWVYPDFIIIDGGKTHLNFAKKIVSSFKNTQNIKLLSIVKDEKHKAREVLCDEAVEKYIKNDSKSIYNKFFILANEETHRFAINFHKFLRNKIKKS